MTLLGSLFGHLFGDSAAEYESRGDQFAGVNNWRRAHEEYERAIQKTPRGSTAYRRVAAKLDDARIQSFENLIEDIHSRIDVREFTYASEQIDEARRSAQGPDQRARVEACVERLRGTGRYEKREARALPGITAHRGAPGPSRPGARVDVAAVAPSGAARLEARAGAKHAGDQPVLAEASPHEAERVFRELISHLPAREVEQRVALGPGYWNVMVAVSRDPSDEIIEPLIDRLQQLRERHPEADFLDYDLGAALMVLGRDGEAEQLLRQRLALHPEDWQAPYELAKLLWQRGAGDKALRVLEQAAVRHPRSGHIQAQWGVLLHKVGATERALEKLYRALELNEFNDAGLFHTIGNLHRELGQREEAHLAFTRSIELNPHGAGAQLDLAEFLIEDRRDGGAALEVLDVAFRSFRNTPVESTYPVYAAYLSSRAHMLLGEREMALLSVSRALEDNEQDWLVPKLEAQRQAVLAV